MLIKSENPKIQEMRFYSEKIKAVRHNLGSVTDIELEGGQVIECDVIFSSDIPIKENELIVPLGV